MQKTHSRSVAGLELGGTKCVAILGSGPGDVRAQETLPTSDPEATLGALEEILRGWHFDALGIASFGPLDLDPLSADFGSIRATTKPGWSGVGLARHFAARFGAPLAIETDVVGAALAEQRWGRAQGLSSHCYITIGTGVGVGLISGGMPVQGAAHGEAGHMRVPRASGDNFAGSCPFHGDCVEGLISGPALARRFGRPGQEIQRRPAVEGAGESDHSGAPRRSACDLDGIFHRLCARRRPTVTFDQMPLPQRVQDVRPSVRALWCDRVERVFERMFRRNSSREGFSPPHLSR
ncbi:ROK family protein [Sphingopyxis flava]|uniref:fructokinase n=1 Tax=Sphingopyxis flava TaxID=1507287 RepID=A0A1T5D5Z8_9SPHN|nr:ROK family protein [Sphingopyxis flava]